MMQMARWQMWMILAIVAFGILFSLPNLLPREQAENLPRWLPHQQISLGLDLQGGASLLLEIDLKTAQRNQLTALVDSIRTRARTDQVQISGLQAVNDTVTFRVRDQAQVEKMRAAVREMESTAVVTTA